MGKNITLFNAHTDIRTTYHVINLFLVCLAVLQTTMIYSDVKRTLSSWLSFEVVYAEPLSSLSFEVGFTK